VLIIAGVPIAAWEATTAYVDLATALYSFLTIYALLNYSEANDRRWAILAGVAAGLAAGTKMTGLGMIAVAVVWILWPTGKSDTRRGRVGTAAIAAGLALLLALPWYIKTFIYTGNPVYPFFYSTLGGRNWSAAAAEFYRSDQLKFGLGRGWKELLALPWNLTFRFARFVDFGARLPRDFYELPVFIGNVLAWLSSVGFVFLASVPIVLCGAFRRGRHRPLMVASLGLVLMWFAMMQNTRYLIPALAVLVPAIAGSAEMIRGRKVMTAVAAVMAIFTAGLLLSFVLPALPAVVGTQSRDEYLEQRLDIYRASKFINESKGKAALLGETRGFYIDQDYVWADPARRRKPQKVEEFTRFDPESRLVIVGDASMAPYELMATDGSIHIEERSLYSSIDRLRLLAKTFRHAAWLNPRSEMEWHYVRTLQTIRMVFPMFELSLDGLEKAVQHLMKK
jgi:hypothetical protein